MRLIGTYLNALLYSRFLLKIHHPKQWPQSDKMWRNKLLKRTSSQQVCNEMTGNRKSIPSLYISLKLIYHLKEQGKGGCEEGFGEIHDRHPAPRLSQVRCNHVNLLEKGDNLKKTLWKRQMVLNKEVVFNLIYRGNLIYTGKMRLFEMTSLWTMPMSPVQLPGSSSTPYWESSLRTIEKSKPW